MRGLIPSPRVVWLLSPTALQRQAPHARFSTLASSRLASQPTPLQRQAPHTRFSTLAMSHPAPQPDSIISASSACEVQYPRLKSPDFSARLQRKAPHARLKGLQTLPI
ncbi:unnamed protein product [Lactuca virosa]|uniref:Uncharacterized protein n=1 Tax=Lactuca virosa TaxID=75947 RepID=A0AAU9LPY0_9ASTR|nr:unnamed protein product [Lactuca virosa]